MQWSRSLYRRKHQRIFHSRWNIWRRVSRDRWWIDSWQWWQTQIWARCVNLTSPDANYWSPAQVMDNGVQFILVLASGEHVTANKTASSVPCDEDAVALLVPSWQLPIVPMTSCHSPCSAPTPHSKPPKLPRNSWQNSSAFNQIFQIKDRVWLCYLV